MAYRRPEPLARHHELDAFACGEPALDEWLKKHARAASASESARVFVVTTDDDTVTVVGYYALAAAHVEPADATERARKGQPSRRPCPRFSLPASPSTTATRAAASDGHFCRTSCFGAWRPLTRSVLEFSSSTRSMNERRPGTSNTGSRSRPLIRCI